MKTVLYEGYAFRCCGDGFKVGDVLEWEVGDEVFPTPYNKKIDFTFIDHGQPRGNPYSLKGTVSHIYISDDMQTLVKVDALKSLEEHKDIIVEFVDESVEEI